MKPAKALAGEQKEERGEQLDGQSLGLIEGSDG